MSLFRYSAPQRRWMRIRHNRRLRAGTPFTLRHYQQALIGHGYPAGHVTGTITVATTTAVLAFQEAFNGGKQGLPVLAPDGLLGPLTKKALRELPWLSLNFTAWELASNTTFFKQGNRPPKIISRGNGDCLVKHELLAGLETIRALRKKPLKVASGFRDPRKNADVGGVRNSRHLRGQAADLNRSYGLTLAQARSLERFGGIGRRRDTGIVTHVDVRPGWATPALWTYPLR